MKYTEEKFGAEARAALKAGMDRVHKATSITMGAKGRNVAMRTWGPIIEPTNDGVQVARSVNPEDLFEKMGADWLKQTAEKTNVEVGDGTTTSIEIAHALVEGGMAIIEGGGAHPIVLRNELLAAKDEAIAALKEISRPIQGGELLDVARISVENEELAHVVADAVEKAGDWGEVVVTRAPGYKIEVEEEKGYFWERGYFSPYMATNERGEAVLEQPSVIVTDKGMNVNKELVPVLNELYKEGITKMFVVADRIEGELLATMVANKQNNIMNIVAVGRPETVEELEDIAFLVRGTAVTKDKGIRNIEKGHVGTAQRIIAKQDHVTIIGHDGPELQARIEDIKAQIVEAPDDEVLKRRLAKLTAGVIRIKVGAKTEGEAKYLKDKVDDAVGACRAAREEGIVDGGGVSLTKIASMLKTASTGATLLETALRKPFEQILENAHITDKGNAWNVLTGERIDDRDMIAHGIMDPTKVERVAIENAVSLAAIFLTTETAIVEREQPLLSLGSSQVTP